MLHARQPIDADGSAGGVAPELNEHLNGEDAGKVLDRSLEPVCLWRRLS